MNVFKGLKKAVKTGKYTGDTARAAKRIVVRKIAKGTVKKAAPKAKVFNATEFFNKKFSADKKLSKKIKSTSLRVRNKSERLTKANQLRANRKGK